MRATWSCLGQPPVHFSQRPSSLFGVLFLLNIFLLYFLIFLSPWVWLSISCCSRFSYCMTNLSLEIKVSNVILSTGNLQRFQEPNKVFSYIIELKILLLLDSAINFLLLDFLKKVIVGRQEQMFIIKNWEYRWICSSGPKNLLCGRLKDILDSCSKKCGPWTSIINIILLELLILRPHLRPSQFAF